MTDDEQSPAETQKSTDPGALADLFCTVTGVTSVTERQDVETGRTHFASEEFDDYERWHDALARHDDLADALESSDTQ